MSRKYYYNRGEIIMNIKNQILDAIDDINLITSECEYNTICEMYNSYDKASMILEYYEGEDVSSFGVFDDTHSFYQESSVSDKMKKSGAKYNTFMKIITFIPRLVKALLQTIKEKFKKIKPSKELQKAPKEVKEKLTTVFDKKKDKKKRIATIASLILGTGVVGVATGVGVHKLRKRNYKKSLDKLGDTIVKLFDEIEDRSGVHLMTLGDLADYREDLKDKVEKLGSLFVIVDDDTSTLKERKRAVRDAITLLNEMKKEVMKIEVVPKDKKEVMKIEAVPKDKKENVVEEINELENEITELENELAELSNASDEDESIVQSSISQNTQEKKPTPIIAKVKKIAEKIVNNIDSNIDDINKRYKALVNKLYSHDSMQLPPDEDQSVGVKFYTDKKDRIEYLCDKSNVGLYSYTCLHGSLLAYEQLIYGIIYVSVSDDEKINERANKVIESFKNKKKSYLQNANKIYFAGSDTNKFINRLEELVKNNEKIAGEFNQESDKELRMTQTVQNAIKTLNDESKFYRDIFYEFLSLYGEMTKLIDDTYSSLKVKASDRYKFDEHAEKFSKINTDNSRLIN